VAMGSAVEDASRRSQADWAGGVGTVVELTVSDVAHGGWCVAREAGGRVVFVRHALPGERVRARITDATANFARAEAVEVVTASPDRVTPPCVHARPGGCGGCDWQHASLAAQRRLKAAVVRHQLLRIAGVDREVAVEPLPGEADGLGWRTRVRFTVGPDGAAGLLAHRSHEVINVADCPISHPLVRAAGLTGLRWDHVQSVEIAVSPESGERAVIVTPNGRKRAPARAAAAGQPPAGDAVAKLEGKADTVLSARRGGRLTTLTGRGYLRQSAAGRGWRVGASAFWQVHPHAADALTAAVIEALRPRPGDVAIDLYCGAGLFAGALAAEVGPDGTVIGVESNRGAVRDARHNLRGMPWARVHAGDVAAVLARGGWPQPRLAVLDPPRTGAARPVIQRLLMPFSAGQEPTGHGRERLNGAPERLRGEPARPADGQDRPPAGLRRVAYVSCDPATLARDVAVFADFGWRLASLRAFDAFPMTHHVECVATLVPEAGCGQPVRQDGMHAASDLH
jgi:tRNA/tmRNA/rRNA uracil-C5-methylase (TrmA/RlmC/RlmD family)